MKLQHEVEYRALINNEVFEMLLDRGQKIYAKKFQGPLIIQDTYFCKQSVKDFSEVEMNDIGSYSLRLRREVNNSIETINLNTKIIKNVGDHNAWLEHEVGLASYEECKKILEAIGFKVFFELKKKRYSFYDQEIHVCLEDINDFQPAIEVEILTTEDKSAEAKKILLAYLAKNNIKEKDILKKSITNMLMRKLASF